MSIYIFLLVLAGMVYLALYHKPEQHSVAQLTNWFSTKLSEIADHLELDIEKDKKGEYPHAGRQAFDRRGLIVYELRDKNLTRFDISEKNALTAKHIRDTDGYRQLAAKAQQLGVSMILQEQMVEGDGVNTFNEIDEYIADFPRYYTVTVSGW